MTAAEIIKEIKRLPRDEQTKIIEFARHVENAHQLSPEELGELTKRLVEEKDPAEADRLQKMIVKGFYGSETDA